jgi:hypothetical protein
VGGKRPPNLFWGIAFEMLGKHFSEERKAQANSEIEEPGMLRRNPGPRYNARSLQRIA